jgi:peptidoglycan/LPS O-acetylase OafA/YrhL
MISDQNKLVSVNIARGLAALSVFVYHYGVGAVLAKYTGIYAFNWIGVPGANYGVTLFFVISGFCIHGSEWRRLQRSPGIAFNLGGYIERRVRRIYPVYLFALLLSCLLDAMNSNRPGLTDVFSHLFLLHGFSATYFNTINLVLWTISIEAFFYIIYPVWLGYRLKAGLGRAFLFGTVLSMACCAFTAAFLYPYSLPVRWFFLNTWGGWLLGALLAETIEKKANFYRDWRWWMSGACLWTLGMWAEAADFYQGHWLILKFSVRIYLCAWPLSALVLCEGWLANAAGISGWLVRILSSIGLASYSLYLLHEPLIQVRNILQNMVNLGSLKLSFQVLWFPIVLFACWLSYRFLELRFMRPAPKVGENIKIASSPVS